MAGGAPQTGLLRGKQAHPRSGAASQFPSRSPQSGRPGFQPPALSRSRAQAKGPGQAPSLGPLSRGSQMAGLPLGAHPLQGRSVKTRVSSSPSGALQSTSSPTNLTLTPFWLKLGGGTNDWPPGLRGEYHNLAKHTRVESATDKGTSETIHSRVRTESKWAWWDPEARRQGGSSGPSR